MTMIDPTDPVEVVIAQILGARLVITEAMHGAIIADALRTRWLAIRPFHHSHRHKWSDWSGSLGLEIKWQAALPSSATEAVTMLTGRGSVRSQEMLRWLRHPLLNPIKRLFIRAAARQLKRIASGSGQLSCNATITKVTLRARKALDAFVRDVQQVQASGRNADAGLTAELDR